MTVISSPVASPADPPWNRLGRRPLGGTSTPLTAGLVAALSFGLVPALVWPLRWATLLDRERAYYRDLAGWWRRRAAPDATRDLDDVLAALRPRPMLVVLPWLATAYVAAILAVGLAHGGPDFLWAATYRYGPAATWRLQHWMPALGSVHSTWAWGLTAAYAIHWYAVRSHGRAIGSLTRWANGVAREHDGGRVRNEAARLGVGFGWTAVAVVGGLYGAWWAIPMAVVGGTRRRYAEKGTPRLQQGLTAQAADVAARADRPAVAVTVRFCPAPACGARLPSVARFCGRCGTPLAQA